MPSASASHIATVRRFNRFFTKRIGALDESHLGTPFSLTEMRILYELAHRPRVTARDLVRDLALDEGYVSRILAGFMKRGLVRRQSSKVDGRVSLLTLTARGQTAFRPLTAAASEAVDNLLEPLSSSTRDSIVRAMHEIEIALGGAPLDANSV